MTEYHITRKKPEVLRQFAEGIDAMNLETVTTELEQNGWTTEVKLGEDGFNVYGKPTAEKKQFIEAVDQRVKELETAKKGLAKLGFKPVEGGRNLDQETLDSSKLAFEGLGYETKVLPEALAGRYQLFTKKEAPTPVWG
jgi:hypothetical protein